MALYAPIEPYEHGMLDVGDGQHLYWEVCGNPEGQPAVVLHGGPGSGCTPGLRQRFDPSTYRIVLFDQRGAGRSIPHAADFGTDLACNTTAHLIGDLETLRCHLGVERWLVHGLSWGSTLALAYGEAHPDRVRAMVLGPVTLTRSSDLVWLYGGVAEFFPEAWECFRAGANLPPGQTDLIAAYALLVNSEDPVVRERAARDWCAWEDALAMGESGRPSPRYGDERFRLGFTRIVTHYFVHRAWLVENELLTGADRLAGIPGTLVHGRLDLGGPARAAWELARAWPGAELVIVEGAGHGGLDAHIAAATDALRR